MRICRTTIALAALLATAGCDDEPTGTLDTGVADAVAETVTDTTTPDVAKGDGPAEVTPATCNAIKQEGCLEGENCRYVDDATAPSCQTAGDKEYGQECAGQGDCAQGTCINLNDTGNYCYKFCKTQLHCSGVTPGAGGKAFTGSCAQLSDSPYNVCEIDVEYDTCDLLAQNCDDATKGCYSSGQPTPVCLAAGSSPVGGNCDSAADCAPGNGCVNTKCYKLCDTAADCETAFAQCSAYAFNAGICEEQ